MSSLVLDVLATTAMSTADLKDKINIIEKEITKLKSEVKEFIEDNYIDFSPTLKKDDVLIEQTEKLIDELKDLQKRIDDQIKIELSGSTKELKCLSQALEESNISLKLSQQLLELDQSLKQTEELQNVKEFIEAAKILQKIKLILNESHNDIQLLNIYAPLRDQYSIVFGTLLTTISELWEKRVFWSEVIDSNKQTTTRLAIECRPHEIQQLIHALDILDELTPCLHHFSNKLSKHIISVIINMNCSVFVEQQNVFNVKNANEKRTDSYATVLHNLKMLFVFLHQHLNVEIQDTTFMKKLNDHLWKTLSSDLLNNCIAGTIPSSSTELEKFKQVEDEIKSLEDYLHEIGFITKEQFVLSDYIKDIDSLYINKICHDILVRASVIMKKDLHDSFKYIAEEPKKYLDSVENIDSGFIDRKMNKNTFVFASCQISNSAKEILDLVRTILDEAVRNTEVCSAKLYYTSRNVIEQYLWTVPEYHKKFLETIPQQVALFHNNCMYLAHNLMTLAEEYRSVITKVLEKHNVTYVDLTLKLRSIGAKYFLNHVKHQQSIILDILKSFGLSELGQDLPANTERSFRQCIRQLELLKTVWLDVLPVNVYSKTIGCILNSMVQDLVLKVVSVEDISATVAMELVNLFNMVVQRAPIIFPEPHKISLYVKKWQQLLQLIKILEASLKDIEDGWSNGRGPFAREFTPSQMKQLIRALFQNTDRRSALLAAIN